MQQVTCLNQAGKLVPIRPPWGRTIQARTEASAPLTWLDEMRRVWVSSEGTPPGPLADPKRFRPKERAEFGRRSKFQFKRFSSEPKLSVIRFQLAPRLFFILSFSSQSWFRNHLNLGHLTFVVPAKKAEAWEAQVQCTIRHPYINGSATSLGDCLIGIYRTWSIQDTAKEIVISKEMVKENMKSSGLQFRQQKSSQKSSPASQENE